MLRTRSALDDYGIVLSESVKTGNQGDFPVSCDQVYLTQSRWVLGRMGLWGVDENSVGRLVARDPIVCSIASGQVKGP